MKPLKVCLLCTRGSVNKQTQAIQAPKKVKVEDDEETKALKEKQKAEAAALAAAKERGEHCASHAYDEAEFGDFPSVERFVDVSRCLPIISELTHPQAVHWVLDSRSTRKRIMQRLRILLTEPTFLSAGLARNNIFTTPSRFPVSVPRLRRSFLYFRRSVE
jgi:hypothetical protein